MSDILSPLFCPHWKAGTFVWCVPFLSCPCGLLLFSHMYILFCSLSSGTEAVRECPHPVAYPPHLFRLPVKLGNTLYMFPHSPHSTLMRCVLYTDLSLRPCFSRKKGVGTEKKKKGRKRSITSDSVPLFLSLYVFFLSLKLAKLNAYP